MCICRDWGRTLFRFWSRLVVGRRLAKRVWVGVGVCVVVTCCVSHLSPLLLLLLVSLTAVAARVLTLAILIG